MPQYVQLKSRFPQIISQLNVQVAAASRTSARLVAASAKEHAPVGSPFDDPHPGRLKASIHVEDRRAKGFSWAVVADAKSEPYSDHPSGMPYAHLVEFGSVHNSPHPFMLPAYELTKAEAVALHREAVVTALGGVGSWK